MFTNVLNEITSRLDARFILTRFFPSLVFWGGLAIIYATDTGLDPLLAQWQAQDAAIQWTQIIIALAWVTFFAYLLSNQLVWLTKQFEGYWDWIPLIGKWLKKTRKKHYQEVLGSIDLKVDYERIYYAFPFPDEPEEVMPTRLGNIMKNAERYSYQRYDMDAVLLWPRLYAVLPDNFLKTIDEAKASLDFMLVVSGLSALSAFITGVYLLIQGTWWLFLLCFFGGLLVAWLAYKSALEAAITYGQLIKSAFDLYKGELWKQLGYQQSKSLAEERLSWRSLYELVYKGETSDTEALHYLGAKETRSDSSPD
jgi:hypothetical protein